MVDPSPNLATAASSTIVVIAPDTAPFDFAGRTAVNNGANSFAVMRDVVFVSSGTAGNYTITSYAYNGYGPMTQLGTLTGLPTSKTLVADSNDVLIGYDPAANGLDVIEVSDPVKMVAVATGRMAAQGISFQKIFPVHRTMTDNFSHSVAVFNQGGITYGSTMWWAAADHRAPFAYPVTLDGNKTSLFVTDATMSQLSWPYLMTYAGGQSEEMYYIDPNPSVALTHTNFFGSTGGCGSFGTIAIDWPNIYVACQNLTSLYWTVATGSGAALTINSLQPLAIAAQHPITRMVVQGGTLYAAEDQQHGRTTVEAFRQLASSTPAGMPALVAAGSYALQKADDLNGAASTTVDVQTSGSSLFAFLQSSPAGAAAAVDVVELGGPRSIVQAARMTRVGTTNYNFYAAGVRGSKAYAMVANGVSSGLAAIDLVSDFAPGTVTSQNFNASCTGGSCAAFALDGDYAYVANSATTLQIFDLTPVAWPGSGAVGTLTAAGTITGVAVANDYLVASISGAGTPYLQVWNIQNRSAPTEVLPRLANAGAALGRGVDVQGRYAYVGTSNGLCVVDFIGGALTQQKCDGTQATFQVSAGAGTKNLAGNYQASIFAVTNGGAGGLPVTNGYYAYDAKANLLTFNPVTFGQFATPGPLLRSGPYLYQLDTTAPLLKFAPPLLGYDISSTIQTGGAPIIAGSYTNLQAPQATPFGLSGPFVVVPDQTMGLTLLRLY